MADESFAPPEGPPPPKTPKVPEGWKAQWNEKYEEWFYVNIYTKKSQWTKPTDPIYPPPDGEAPEGPPPSYDHGSAKSAEAEKSRLSSNNPYASKEGLSSSQDISEDERLARQLQAEEDARASSSSRGAADNYYGQPGGVPPGLSQPQGGYYDQQQLPSRTDERASGKKGGFLGKLFGKASGSSGQHASQSYGGYPPQQSYGGGMPGYQPQPGYGYPQQQQQYYGGNQPPKKSGLGVGGAAALGLGGGLIGGALIADAVEDHDQNEYDQGYDQGQDGGGFDDGGDFGGDF